METVNRIENELFITRVRWLTLFGAPFLLWFYLHQFFPYFILVSVVFGFFNGFLQFYLIKRIDVSRYTVAFSVLDSLYVTHIYILSAQDNNSLPQIYFFLILVMGIRHGLAKYNLIILICSFLYVAGTIVSVNLNGIRFDFLIILTQLFFFAGFGVMSSFVFKANYQQQIEKEDLISELQAAYQQLCVYNAQVEELANTDPLTGVFNYRYFTERLDKELELSKRFNRPLSLIIIDIDFFKDFNDTYGHPAGDLALRDAAKIFRQNIRDKDVLCRYGGEEFLILLPSTGIEEAYKCAERIREAVEHHAIHLEDDQPSVYITISGGVACYPLDADNGDQLLRIADEVLYSAKHKGRNKIHRRL